MHIKKLEICGFKSFIDRTVIHFDHDVIGIVGPNGCGKSNVVDAIRWVMGEQSPKALRGKSMADVIFGGSESRSPAGFCEVTVTFDNGDPAMAQQLPVEYRDYPELAVTRRVYRGDGANDYFINKTPVRLRDVTDVFLGTGVGRKAYSIVEQGKIGVIVSARPEDRRVLIEEAAGITKYKARKRQAESKMSATRQNLARVGDIVNEIERQLASLKRQAAKAARYQRYRGELEDLWLWDASHRLLELVVTTEVASTATAQLGEQAERQRGAVTSRDAEIEVLRQQTHAVEQETEQAQNAAFVSDNTVREHEAHMQRGADQYRALGQRLEEARQEQHALRTKAAELAEEQATLGERLACIDADRQRAAERAAEQAHKLDALQQEASQAAARLELLRDEDATRAATMARAEEALSGCQGRIHESQQRLSRIGAEHTRLASETSQLADRRRALAARVDELVTRKDAMCDARDALRQELPQLQAQLEPAGETRDATRQQLAEKQSRLHALGQLATQMEGVGAGVKSLLQTGDAALGGLVADHIEVPPEYTAAVAALVGERLQCVIVDDVERGVALLRALADGKRGRATLLPRQHAEPAAARPDIAAPGVRGLLVDAVRFTAEDGPLVRRLFGHALLVDDADTARRVAAAHAAPELVTLDGMVFHRDGRISGGAGDHLAATMLEHKREIAELRTQVARLSEEARGADQQVASLRLRHRKLQRALDEAKSEAHDAVLAMVTGEQDLRRLDQRLELVAKRQREVAAELAAEEQAIEASSRERQGAAAELTTLQQAAEQARSGIEAAEQRHRSSRQQLDEQQARYTEHKVLLASINERATAGQAALSRIEREHAEVSERIAALELDRTRCAREAGQAAAAIMLARAAAIDARGQARRAHADFETARQQLDGARHELALREAELREMRTALDTCASALQQQEMELQRLRLERQHLDAGVRERFRGLELSRVVGDYHARPPIGPQQRSRISELGGLIDRMGSVNLDAMTEYQQARERYQFFTQQRADLDAALADLERAITQMNRESRRLFKHAFEGINRRFIEIFPKMFRGGKAELRLTDPADLLETGIDILAQPPGKRLGHIELMSGGEKAFTAVSLLLAIFRYKPSPFCILDEVDAPLDEANIARYTEAVRAMTDRSQFILITHSRRTMESVDVLYGVTMQEPGVSKLVGVRVGNTTARSVTHRPAIGEPSTDLAAPATDDEQTDERGSAVA